MSLQAPTVVILCGPAYAGKTTLAHALARKYGLSIVSADGIMAERRPKPPYTDDDWAQVHVTARSRLCGQLAEGRSVVVDDTGCFRFLRDHFREDAAKHGARPLVVTLRIADEDVWSRQRANRANPQRPDVDDAVLRSHLATFEWPSDDEPTVELDGHGKVEDWIAKVSRALSESS